MTSGLVPGEIWDHVLDCVAQDDDKQFSDLKTLCLVQKSFVSRSRCHLFHSLHLRQNSSRPSNMLRIMDESPELRFYVKKLELENPGYDSHREGTADSQWIIHSLPALAQNFSHVKGLTLRNADFPNWENAAIDLLTGGFVEVTHLWIYGPTIWSRELDFSHLVASFPKLRVLRVGFTVSSHSVLATVPPPPPSLEEVDGYNWDLLAPWLMMRRPFLPIRRLGFRYLNTHTIPLAINSMAAFGSQLKVLCLAIADPQDFFGSVSQHMVPPLPVLSVVVFEGLIIDRVGDEFDCFDWVCPFLHQIGSSTMECIKFKIQTLNRPGLDSINWSGLDQVLDRDQWKQSLKRVSFTLSGIYYKSIRSAERGLREGLPRMAHRRLLDFRFDCRNRDGLLSQS